MSGSVSFRKRKRNPKVGNVQHIESDNDDSDDINIPNIKRTKKEIGPKPNQETAPKQLNKDLNVTDTIIQQRKEVADKLQRDLEIKSQVQEYRDKIDENKKKNNAPHQYVEVSLDQVRSNKYTGAMGPIRAPVHYTASNRFDYQPDVCKDYKETGYCSFGDSCIFLHDRSDYKAGWEIERDYNEEQRKKKAAEEKGDNDDSDDDDDDEKYVIDTSDDEDDNLPFACYICKQHFVKPVVTNCRHYFCQKCALDRYRKTSKCAVCGAETSGCFNKAKDIEEKMKKLNE